MIVSRFSDILKFDRIDELLLKCMCGMSILVSRVMLTGSKFRECHRAQAFIPVISVTDSSNSNSQKPVFNYRSKCQYQRVGAFRLSPPPTTDSYVKSLEITIKEESCK